MTTAELSYILNNNTYTYSIPCCFDSGIEEVCDARHEELYRQYIDGSIKNVGTLHWYVIKVIFYVESTVFITFLQYLITWLKISNRCITISGNSYNVFPVEEDIPISYIVGDTYSITMQLMTCENQSYEV
jgi:hypothetical protein